MPTKQTSTDSGPGGRNAFHRMAWRDRVLLPLFLILSLLYQTRGHADDGPGAATLVTQGMDSGFYQVMPYVDSEVDIQVSGMVARVTVTQHFFNDTGEWLEGKYLFPLPENAAIDQLRLIIGDRIIEGEIREKEQARREYAAARKAGKRAGLVEQHRPNLFSTEITNLAPDEYLVVEIGYLQQLDFADGGFSLRFPMTLTERYTPGKHAADGQPLVGDAPGRAALDVPPPRVAYHGGSSPASNMTSITVSLNAGMPLDQLESSYHDVDMTAAGDQWLVQTDLVPGDRDFVLNWSAATGGQAQATVFTEQIGDDHFVLLMVMPPQQITTPLAPRELIFIIDTSGSMVGDSMEQARAALLWGLNTLRQEDRFNIIQFNSDAHKLFPVSRPADASRLRQAQRYVDELIAEGGTDMAPAIALALEDEIPRNMLRQVVFVTDGSVGNERELFTQIQTQLGDARLFTIGIGAAPNSYFMRKAAHFGRGSFTYVGSTDDVQQKMSDLFAKLEFPVMRDLCINWPVPVESYPRALPDLYLGQPVVISARYRGDIDETELCGGADGTWSQFIALSSNSGSAGIASLWARQRIEWLMDSQILGADSSEVRAQVLETALAHHLVSPYTSLVAVDKTPVRSVGQALKQRQVANNLPHGHSVGLPQGASGLPGYLLLALIGIALTTFGWRLRSPDPQTRC